MNTETTVETLGPLTLVHVTAYGRRKADAYELRNGADVIAWAHKNGAMFAVNVGNPDAPLADRKFLGLATSREAAIATLRKVA